jgi:hypothetical protein
MRFKTASISDSVFIVRFSTRSRDIIEIRDLRLTSQVYGIIYPPLEGILDPHFLLKFESRRFETTHISMLRLSSQALCIFNFISRKICKKYEVDKRIQYVELIRGKAIIIGDDKAGFVNLDVQTGRQQYAQHELIKSFT